MRVEGRSLDQSVYKFLANAVIVVVAVVAVNAVVAMLRLLWLWLLSMLWSKMEFCQLIEFQSQLICHAQPDAGVKVDADVGNVAAVDVQVAAAAKAKVGGVDGVWLLAI